MMTLLFATQNSHKVSEAQDILGRQWLIRSLKDVGIHDVLPETGNALEDHAREKANYIYQRFGLACFAEDTGLEVLALGGAPGVHTARYAGPNAPPEVKMQRLMDELGNATERSARFRTIIALWWQEECHMFEGEIRGRIATMPAGTGGFGYDPVFIPEGYSNTFAELPAYVKAGISHRYQALNRMRHFLTAHLRQA
ncbi:MAG: RdgB/HAM1 family non-canonical purine NTP pyrophosphatase [Saprospiraceae bacterium]|nr:RdgB/HAM1 family non-canonical purine NTP pyrophosphatase [Saprospiraceae bacterium]